MKWDAIQTALGQAFRIVSADPERFVVGVPMKVADAEHVQEVSLKPTVVDTVPWLAMISPVAGQGQLDFSKVVAIQDHIPIGAIVARGEVLLLRHGVAMPPLTPEGTCWNVGAFARAALKIRVNLRSPAPSGAFAHYIED